MAASSLALVGRHALHMDKDDASRLAGVAIAHQDAINRVFHAAASLADGRE